MKANLQTKNGIKVTNVQEIGDIIIGFIDGKAMVWHKDGRRSAKYKSRLDLNLSNTHYVAIRKWGGEYKSKIYQHKPKGKGIVKVIEVEI